MSSATLAGSEGGRRGLLCAGCESVVSWEWLDRNPAVANSLLAGVRRRDPEGFAAFCARVVLAKIEYRDRAQGRRPRHADRPGDSGGTLAAVRERFGGGN